VKFPRNARIFRGQLDAAPFAIVFFLLVIFMMLSSLLYTPGVALQLPVADDLPGTDKPSVRVALDKNGRYYYENKSVEEGELLTELKKAVGSVSPQPLTLVVFQDEAITYKMMLRLRLIARNAGISDVLLAALPRPIGSPSESAPK